MPAHDAAQGAVRVLGLGRAHQVRSTTCVLRLWADAIGSTERIDVHKNPGAILGSPGTRLHPDTHHAPPRCHSQTS